MKRLWVLIATFILLSCGGANYFEEASIKDSDEALYEQALLQIDTGDYGNAIANINATSASYRTQSKVVRSLAAAYAGRCGLNFLDFVAGLNGSGAPFGLFKNAFTTATVSPSDCQSAQQVIETAFGNTAATRTVNLGTVDAASVNMFMAVLGMSKIGTTLRAAADSDQNGTNDAGYDSCNSAKLDDSAAKQVGTGFALIIDNFAVIASSFDPATAGLISGISATCGALNPNPCAISDPNSASWDAAALLAIRSMVKSNTFGIENCASSDPPNNPAPFPFSCCP